LNGGDEAAEVEQDDSLSEASSSGLPLPLITAEDYDAMVCRSCVSKIPILQAWAGTPGISMVVRDDPDSTWNVIGALQEDDLVVDDPVAERSQAVELVETDIPTPSTEVPDSERTLTPTRSLSGDGSSSSSNADALQTKKRTLPTQPSISGPSVKRSRTFGPSNPSQKLCQAPAPNSSAQAIFAQDGTRTLGEGDIFLSGDWRERWCLCDLCLPRLQEHPYLLKEDDTYEPPEDPDSGKLQSVVDVGRTENGFVGLSLEELGLRALERIPRDRALDGIRAFNSMRYVLRQYFPKYLGITN
jgi:E3 ubiquitin-protein ligase UBR7